MRKITRDAARALLNGQNFHNTNTRVENGVLTLFGNAIAKIENGHLMISNAGWDSPTTKERLNGVLDIFGTSARVFTKNFTPMLSTGFLDAGSEWDGKWTKITRRFV